MNVKFVTIISFQILPYRCVTVNVLSIFLTTHTHTTPTSVSAEATVAASNVGSSAGLAQHACNLPGTRAAALRAQQHAESAADAAAAAADHVATLRRDIAHAVADLM